MSSPDNDRGEAVPFAFEDYLEWLDREEEKSTSLDVLVERPFKLDKAFSEARNRARSEAEKAYRARQQVKNLERALSKEREKITRTEQANQRLRNRLHDIRNSRTWRILTGIARLRAAVHRIYASFPRKQSLTTRGSVQQLSEPDTPSGRPDKTAAEHDKRQIKIISAKLYDLGFTDRAVGELKELVGDDSRPLLKRLAAWELAIWYAEQPGANDAMRCLEYLDIATRGTSGPENLRHAAILKAEALVALRESGSAAQEISSAPEAEPATDSLLARANLETSESARVRWINEALRLYGIPEISFDESTARPLLDSLRPRDNERKRIGTPNDVKVSVIMTVCNAGDEVRTALDSVVSQTWGNLEVLVVDDCGTDRSVSLLQEYANADSRVRLLQTGANRGAYAARNLALREATGEFVTCHDAGGWSNPEKIERQALHLLRNPHVVGNTSQQFPVSSDLEIYRMRRPGPWGLYVFYNTSSLMFRREVVVESVGYWDRVRFGADEEFRRRIEKVLGQQSVVDLPTGPLSFTLHTGGSPILRKDPGVFVPMGARMEYQESYSQFHSVANADSLRYEFFPEVRPFPAPATMLPAREGEENGRRHFDVVLASDFRLPGGTTSSNVEEIKAQKRLGLRTGLVQMPRYSHATTKINQKVRDLIDGDLVQMLVYGERASCDTLLLRHPPAVQDWWPFVPEVEAADVRVLVNQTPRIGYGEDSRTVYTLKQCEKHVLEHFGNSGLWHPISPLVRMALQEHHEEELRNVRLADEDWPNIIDVSEWRRDSRPKRRPKIRIGRHSSDLPYKWPCDCDELLAAYPDSDGYEVRVLGGAKAPERILGSLPQNWRVFEFGEVHPKDFLSTLDVFVYYTDRGMVEAFGRVIVEAMAVGVPTILPHSYYEAFKEAAIYAEPSEVKENIDWLMDDDARYESQVKIARNYVEKQFGYANHAARLGKLLLD